MPGLLHKFQLYRQTDVCVKAESLKYNKKTMENNKKDVFSIEIPYFEIINDVLSYLNDKCLPDHVATSHTRVRKFINKECDWNQSAWDCCKIHYDVLRAR